MVTLPGRFGLQRAGLVLSVLLLLAAVGCSGGEDANGADGGDDQSDDLAMTDDVTADRSEPDAGADSGLVEVDALPTEGPGGQTPPTTEGSELPPVVVRTPPSGGDPQGIYRGVIGGLEPDELVADDAIEPPTGRPGVLPLTGLAGDVDTRPALAVKIDNGPAAQPHTGLNAADIVIEEEVEGGVTRFAAIFHSTSSIVGPVRSGRTTDVSLLGGLGSTILLYSGANEITQQILADQPFLDLRSEGWSSGFWRDSGRRAPSNLYTDTEPHWASASTADTAPPQQFAYRDPGQSAAGASIDEFAVAYPSSTARWEWAGDHWQRWQRNAQHLLVNGQQVSAANVVVIEADEVATGMTDSSGGAVPEFVFVGSGRAAVFTDGVRIDGTWTKPTLTSVATFTDADGDTIELTRGRTWIQLVADMGALS
jgi:hypothetical protein